MIKFKKKIEGWQVKYLSIAGCVTLIKSTSASIPIHAMQTTLLPQKNSLQVDKLNYKFLWGDIAQHRHCHTISWETIATPREVGGLGLKSMPYLNVALLMN